MKLFIFSISLLMAQQMVLAFVAKPSSSVRNQFVALNAAVELKPEPEGGVELTALKSMEGSRMKNMGEAEGVKSDKGVVHKFWLKAEAQGTLIKELNTQVMKDAAKKANFPGFRKGQIPPYAMPQIRGFAVQEGIIQTVQSAVDAYGLKSISGSDGEVEVQESVPDIAKGYKMGDNVPFTATFQAVFDSEKIADTPAGGEVLDVEAEAA